MKPFDHPWLACTFSLLLLIGLPGCITSGFEIGGSGAVFIPEMSGDLGLESTVGGVFADVDLNQFGLEERDNVPYARVWGSALGLNVWASGFQYEEDGRGTLNVGFGDLVAGVPVNAEMELTTAQAGFTFPLIDLAGVRLAPGVGVDYFDLNMVVDQPTVSLREEIDTQGPIPLLFLEGSFDPPVVPLILEARVGAIAGTYGDIDGKVIDAEATLSFNLLDPLEVFAGYRLLRFDVDGTTDGQDFSGDILLDGFIFGGSLRF